MFSNVNWTNVFSRAAWTFMQAAGAVLAGDTSGVVSLDLLQMAGIAGVAAVLSIAKTLILEIFGSASVPE